MFKKQYTEDLSNLKHVWKGLNDEFWNFEKEDLMVAQVLEHAQCSTLAKIYNKYTKRNKKKVYQLVNNGF